ncbi:MAG: S-layer homology domain-containing protein [Candidatus Abawacabacteria bacterium]|nr:S-layer homology domain-containing protein [Candidatus Abawacabacteria bacterium]
MRTFSGQRLLSLSVVSALVFVMGFEHVAAANFPDVPTTHQSYQAVQYLRDRNIINGYPDGLFRPDNVVTRAELIKIAANGAGIATVSFANQTPSFRDVANTHALKQYINWAFATGAVKGYGEGIFRPDAAVTRGEAAKILLKINNLQPEPPTNYYLIDAPQTMELAPYIYFSVLKNLALANGNIYGTGIAMKRGEVAEMMYRLLVIKQNNYAPFGANPSTPSPTAAAVVPKTVNVSMQSFRYNPPALSINAGDTVVWKNMDTAPHTVTVKDLRIGDAGYFDSGSMGQNQTFSFTFTKKGTFNYTCIFHPEMVGSITVN